MAARTTRNTQGLELRPSWWVALAFVATMVGSAAAAWLKNTVAPSELGVADGIGLGALFLATLALALGAAGLAAMLARRRDESRGVSPLTVAAAVCCLTMGLVVSGYIVDRQTDARVNDVLASVTPSEGVTDIQRLPGYTEPYYARTTDSLSQRLDRTSDTYLGQFGVPLALAGLLIGGCSGWLLGRRLPRRTARQREASSNAAPPLAKVGSLETKATITDVAFANIDGKQLLIARTRNGVLVVDVDGGRKIAARELAGMLDLAPTASWQTVQAHLSDARVSEPFLERADWAGAARSGSLIARPAGTSVEVWRAAPPPREAAAGTDFWSR